VRVAALMCLALAACEADADAWAWDLPDGFPEPFVPADNPMTASKVELGRHLFYDERLSHNGTMACASCHEQRLAFTDGKATTEGSTGHALPRSSMGLINVAYLSIYTWANPKLADARGAGAGADVRRLSARARGPAGHGGDPAAVRRRRGVCRAVRGGVPRG
jgi:cytochrome c peroxidase